MGFALPKMKKEERVALQLRALYEEKGYKLFRMGSFEEYDLYLQNKSFLTADDIISFSGEDGRLMALKPDVTLSIVKNTPAGVHSRVYYNENVYRRSRQSGDYKEIHQMGLEFIGGSGAKAEAEVLSLAADSIAAVGKGALDLSHMEYIEAMLAGFADTSAMQPALDALRDKSPHGMLEAAQMVGLPQEEALCLAELAMLTGPFESTMARARELANGRQKALRPLDELTTLYECLAEKQYENVEIRLDFSILNDTSYYNGLIFQGFVQGLPRSVLGGGRYDKLLHRFNKPQGAIGFALYLDTLGRGATPEQAPTNAEGFAKENYLNVALPKGRLGSKVYSLLEKAGFGCSEMLEGSRKLVFEDADNMVRYFLVKPSDVDIYVERGAADIGVVGRDVLLESGADVLELLDLKLGACRLAVAGKVGFVPSSTRPLRVATKYKNVARKYYAERSQAVELIKLHGSIELAPLLGLSDVIVDIVETGATLKENDLAVLAEIEQSSARLIANRAAWRFKGDVMRLLAQKMGELV